MYLSNADASFLLGNGPKVIKSEPMIRRQGNGNLTGFVRKTYSDGRTADHEFIMNARTVEAVRAAYAISGLAA